MNENFSANPASGTRQAEPKPISRPAYAPQIDVGGLTALSATDYPGMLAAVVFCQGCPWRCGYCQNPHLMARRSAHPVSWREVRAFLRRRRDLLDAVVFSGGEPTLQRGLLAAVKEVKEMGFLVGLHTGGAYPYRLAQLLPYLDWVGMDIKAGFADYDRITIAAGSGEHAKKSAQLLLDSGVAHEFRTTVHPLLISHHKLNLLAEELAQLGVKHYVLQQFRTKGCANPDLVKGAEQKLPDDLCAAVGARFEHFTVR